MENLVRKRFDQLLVILLVISLVQLLKLLHKLCDFWHGAQHELGEHDEPVIEQDF